VLRRHLRGAPERELTVLVLSARFGLIPADRPIPDYDQPMTRARADELDDPVCRDLRERIDTLDPRRVGLCLGRAYRRAVSGFEDDPPTGVDVQFLAGGLGRRLTALGGWLERESLERESSWGKR
jgi:hypothetical protein